MSASEVDGAEQVAFEQRIIGDTPVPVRFSDLRAAATLDDPGDFLSLLLLIDKPRRLDIVSIWVEALGPRLPEILALTWTMTEAPTRNGVLRMVKLFQRAGFVTDTEAVSPPTEPLTVYRGMREGSPPRRMSWTTDLACAAWFAKRFEIFAGRDGHSGRVVQAIAAPEAVLGILHGRQESEVIVNPRRLRQVQDVPRHEWERLDRNAGD